MQEDKPMGEQKQFRSEEARKNFEKQEKKRVRAAQRKKLRARKQALTTQATAWLKANPKQAALTALAVIAAAVLIWLGCKWCFGPGGSIPNFFGHLRGVEDTWVVTDLNPRSNQNRNSSAVDGAPRSKTPRFFHLATFQPLEGFTQDVGFTLNSDTTNQDQHYTATEEGGAVESVYVFGIANKTAEKHMSDVLNTLSVSNVTGEVRKENIGGFDTLYSYFVYDQAADENGEVTEAYGSLCLCIDTTEDACVLVILNTYILPTDEVPAEDALLAEAEKVLSNLTVY